MTDRDMRPLAVPCPTCGADLGEPCAFGPDAQVVQGIHHLSRLDLWGLVRRRSSQDAPGATETAETPGVAPGATTGRSARLH